MCILLQRTLQVYAPPLPALLRHTTTLQAEEGEEAQVQFSWCWAVRDKYLLPGSAIPVPRPALALACPFLTSISRPVAP